MPVRAVADVVGRHLGLPVASIAPDDADAHFGWRGPLLAVGSPASSTLTRESLGWQPTRPGLLDDLDTGHYFRAPSA